MIKCPFCHFDNEDGALFCERCTSDLTAVTATPPRGAPPPVLPAIPMAIVSREARFHLVEVDKKKWAFLKHIARACELNAVIYGDRLARAVTRFPPELRFSLVTSRAVGNPEEWVPLLAPWMQPDGRVALFQSTADVPAIAGFDRSEAVPLPRGASNYLVTLTFHVEQH